MLMCSRDFFLIFCQLTADSISANDESKNNQMNFQLTHFAADICNNTDH